MRTCRYRCYCRYMSEAEKVTLAGHAYRPTPNPLSYRGITPGCECGEHLLGWPVTRKTARYIHREHKKAIIRERAAK